MTRKNLTIVAALVAIVAILAVGTVAYFTDTDSATNTFTVGNVKIELIEQQRNANGTALETFTQNKVVNPIVGNVEEGLDTNGMPTKPAFVDKIVTVKNTGANAAYIRCYFAIPAILDDGAPSFNASNNALHFNFGRSAAGKNSDVASEIPNPEWFWKTDDTWNCISATIDGTNYNVYFADYYKAIEKDEVTTQFVSGVYLDMNVGLNDEGHLTKGGADLGDWSDGIVCPVAAIAVQAEGFDTPKAAFDAAFPSFNPFAAE